MQPLHTEQFEGFDIAFYALPEDTDPADSFEDPEDIRMCLDGTWDYFCAKVTASKSGIELGTDYLGCCAYANASDFPKESGGYFEDMRAEAIRQAQTKLAELRA